MTQLVINVGAEPNDGQGDPLRTAYIKINDNFNAIWNAATLGSNVIIANNTIGIVNANGNMILQANGTGSIQTGSSVLPTVTNTYSLGSADARYLSAFVGTGGITTTGNITANYVLGNGSQLTGIQTSVSELTNSTKTFSLAANGIVSMPTSSSFFDSAQDYPATGAHTLDEFDITQYRTAKYIVQATNIDTGNSVTRVHSTEVLLTHNGVDTFITEYANLVTSSALITLDSFIANGNAVLEATTLAANTVVDLFRVTLIPGVPPLPVLDLQGDLMLQTGSQDLNVGLGAQDLNN
jgi:hypothetical protein